MKIQSAPFEIERKFLVKKLPKNLKQFQKHEIWQDYLYIKSNQDEARIRQQDNKYFKTAKIGKGKIRHELESEISKQEFDKLSKQTLNLPIKKTRYLIPYKNHLLELNLFHGKLKGFKMVEVEFKSLTESNEFLPPDWLGKEITNDKRYRNTSLVRFGVPT